MAHKSRQTFQKAQREKNKQQKRQAKLERRVETRQQKSDDDVYDNDNNAKEDPDIAGIRPGPQPLPAWWNEE